MQPLDYWSVFSSVVGVKKHVKVKQWFPHCFDMKTLLSYLWNPHYSLSVSQQTAELVGTARAAF